MRWQKESLRDISIKFMALFLSPILAILFSLINLKTKSSFIVLFITFLSFGAALTVPKIRTDNFNFDAIAYRNDFESYQKISTANFFQRLDDYLSFEGTRDFYADMIYFFTSRITDNYHLMFFIISIIFSLFMLKSLKMFVLDGSYSNNLISFILLYAFLINQVLNINAFRYFTAAWLFVYAALKILVQKKNRYIILLLLTPFFHASFFLVYVLLLGYLLLRKHISILFSLYITSFFLSGFVLVFFEEMIPYLPPILGERLLVYMNDDYMYAINESGSGFIWIKRGMEFLTYAYVNFLTLILIIRSKDVVNGTKCESLFAFLLVLLMFVNLTISIPSLGSRFLISAFPLLAYIWLVCCTQKKYNKYIYGFGVVMGLQFIMPFSIYLFPCLQYYSQLWESIFFFVSPFYSIVEYLLWC